MPAAYSSWGTFNELDDRNNAKLRAIASTAMAQAEAAAESPQGLVGAFYAAALDEARLEQIDAQPLAADLKAIDRLRRRDDVAALVRAWHARGTPVLFGLNVRQDLKDNTRLIAYASHDHFEWHNYYDPDDVLGWPLADMSDEYARVVTDHRVNAGSGVIGWLLKSWNPMAHTQYWGDTEVLGPLEAKLRSQLA